MKHYLTIAKAFIREDVTGEITIKGESGLTWNLKKIAYKPNHRILEI